MEASEDSSEQYLMDISQRRFFRRGRVRVCVYFFLTPTVYFFLIFSLNLALNLAALCYEKFGGLSPPEGKNHVKNWCMEK